MTIARGSLFLFFLVVGGSKLWLYYDTIHEYSTIQCITIVQFDASDRENSGTIIIDVIYL